MNAGVVRAMGRVGQSKNHLGGDYYHRRRRQPYHSRVEAMLPIAYWPFDEPAGTVLADRIAAADGAYVGATLGMAQFSAMPVPYFDGINDYASLPYGSLGGLNGKPLSFSVWLWRANWNPGVQYVLLYAGYGATNNRWRLYYNSAASQVRFEWLVAGTPYVSYIAAASLVAGWHHFVGVAASGGNVLMYVDNAAQTLATGAALLTGISEAWVCSGTTPPSSPNVGYVARYVLFDRVLTASERASLSRLW